MSIIPEPIRPEHPIARWLLLAFSMMTFGLLLLVVQFLFRELNLELFVSDPQVVARLTGDDFANMWMAGLRFDSRFVFMALEPAVILILPGLASAKLWPWTMKLLGAYCAAVYAYFFVTTVVNIHHMALYGVPVTAAAMSSFYHAPFDTIVRLWSDYPFITDFFLLLLTGLLFWGLWLRLTYVLSTWRLWHPEHRLQWIVCFACLAAFTWTIAQTPLTTSDPLTAEKAMVSSEPSLNACVLSGPMAVIYGESLFVQQP